MSSCRSCDAPIVWAHTEHGRRIPLDRMPYAGDDPRGLFVLRQDPRQAQTRGGTRVAVAATPDAFPGELLYRSHFATCPHANRWRHE